MAPEYQIDRAMIQEAVFDGGYKATVDDYLLMCIVNNGGTNDEDEIAEMKNPKRLAVRVIIETRELPL